MAPVERPTFKELYEAQTKKMDEMERRLNRVEKLVMLLFVVMLSPKVGGPEASNLVASAISLFTTQ